MRPASCVLLSVSLQRPKIREVSGEGGIMFRAVCIGGLALAGAACASTSSENETSSGLLPRMSALPDLPSMPDLPNVNLISVSIPGTGREAPQVDEALEPVIYWRVIEDDILVVHASTQGCTSRSDFTVNVEQYHEDVFTVRLVRDDEDRCERDIPWGIQLGFGFEELGVPIGGRVIVLNPIDDRPWDWNAQRYQTASR